MPNFQILMFLQSKSINNSILQITWAIIIIRQLIGHCKMSITCLSQSSSAQGQRGHAIAYVLHTSLSWAQLRAYPADSPQSEQISCSHVMGRRPHGGIPSRMSDAMCKTALACMLSGIRTT